MSIHTLLATYDEHIQNLAEQTKELIQKTLPGVQEYPDEKARVIGYGYANTYKDTICTIILSKKEIKLGFYKGSELPDPAQLLTGTGKVHKYVALKNEGDIRNNALTNLLEEAYKAYKERQQ